MTSQNDPGKTSPLQGDTNLKDDSVDAHNPASEEPVSDEIAHAHTDLNRGVWDLQQKVTDLESDLKLVTDTPWYSDRRFWAGALTLPVLVLSGWVFQVLDEYVIQSPFFEPLPFLHSVLGTETAINAYVAPDEPERKSVRDEIKDLFKEEYVQTDELNKLNYVTETSLAENEFVTRADFERVPGLRGRNRPNFNDLYITQLGLDVDHLDRTDCDVPPVGSEILRFEIEPEAMCFAVGDNFRYDASFQLLKPRDVIEVKFEIFLIPLQAKSADNSADNLITEYASLTNDVRDKLFTIFINNDFQEVPKLTDSELDFAPGLDAYKYELHYEALPHDINRSYDVLHVSIALNDYLSLFDDGAKDRAFSIYVVPSFVTEQ